MSCREEPRLETAVLIDRARGGDGLALGQLLERYRNSSFFWLEFR